MKIFKLNEYEWWCAETMTAAILAACQESGLSEDETIDDPYEVGPEELAQTKFFYEDGDRTKSRSMAEQLEIDRAAGRRMPYLFACTEY